MIFMLPIGTRVRATLFKPEGYGVVTGYSDRPTGLHYQVRMEKTGHDLPIPSRYVVRADTAASAPAAPTSNVIPFPRRFQVVPAGPTVGGPGNAA